MIHRYDLNKRLNACKVMANRLHFPMNEIQITASRFGACDINVVVIVGLTKS